VANLFSNTFQAITSADDKTLHLQNCFKTLVFFPSQRPLDDYKQIQLYKVAPPHPSKLSYPPFPSQNSHLGLPGKIDTSLAFPIRKNFFSMQISKPISRYSKPQAWSP